MELRDLTKGHARAVCDLWNNTCDEEGLSYFSWDVPEVSRLFLTSRKTAILHSFVCVMETEVVAFVSGTWVPSTNRAYLTTLLVDSRHRNQGVGKHLLTHLEQTMRHHHPTMTTMETVFFNPVHLRIQLSDTPMHHPNAPGIPQSSSLVGFLLVRGYGVYATQDVFLRTLDDALPPAPTNASSLHVTAYDPDKYKDWDNLWSDLRNPHWEQAITQSLQDHPNRPILIVTDGSGIYGFAGPLYLDETGRGCFAGIGVHSSLRGQGLGKSLFEQLCRSFRDMGATYMSLFTGQENPAGRLYRKTGFRVVESFVNLRKTWSGLDGTNVRDSSERL